MERVGLHLQRVALSKEAAQQDIFARSSYNRYYYALFLTVRDMFRTIEPHKWDKVGHKDYPQIITGPILKELRDVRKSATKLSDRDLITKSSAAISAANNLANLMTEAYAVRVVADYYPETTVVFIPEKRFSLNEVNITEAHKWPSKAKLWVKSIAEVLEQ